MPHRCLDMKGFKVAGQQLGVVQTETMALPCECRHFGHATKLHSFNSRNTHEDPGFGGETRVTTLTRISVARNFLHLFVYVCVCVYVCACVCVYMCIYMVCVWVCVCVDIGVGGCVCV